MKKLSLLVVLLLCGTTQAKNIQNPIWYSLSEKILTETQELLAPEREAKPVKKVKVKPATKQALRCVDKKKEINIQAPIALPADGF